ncbi:MAG: cation-transporting P-type ATPase [Methylobacter sp.]|nr:MAG: cation-transporting P-type ATPase [Methylobacter sp.]
MDPDTQDNKPQNYLLIIHNRVAGRTRIKVPGLYRNDRLRANLESRLTELDEIRLAYANTLTGNLLIEYAAPQDTGEMPVGIARLLEAELGGPLIRHIESIDRPPKKVLRKPKKARRRLEAVEYQAQPLQLWHTLSGTRVVNFLQSSEQGLTQEVAAQRLVQYGANVLSEQAGRSSWQMFLGQFMSAPVAMLGVSAAVSLATGGVADTVVIVAVVLVNSVIGYATEKTAEKTINALGQLTPETAVALRDGFKREIPMPDVALGDLLVLAPGSYIPADARLLASHRLTVDESPLTGESLPISKNHEYVGEEDIALGDRQNMVYMGTIVTGGDGRAIAVATGRHTEIGKIQELVGIAKAPETPMQKQIDDMGMQLALLSSGICVLVFAVGLLRGRPLPQMLMSAISLAVAAVPEGLPTVATTTLALGIKEMKRQKVLIRQLPAVENLGSAQVICLDKTGTLTLNQMSVVTLQTLHAGIKVKQQGFYQGKAKVDLYRTDQTLRRMMEVLMLCNESMPAKDGAGGLQGSPTENALLQVAIDADEDVHALRQHRPMVKVDYRAEDRPYMISVHSLSDGQFFSAVKGSPAEVLELCQQCSLNGRVEVLSEDQRKTILTWNERLGADALRVLGVAYCITEGADDYKQREFIWLGLVGMEDVIRPGMEELMAQFHDAGIETVMITGDQSSTAYSVGKRLGLNGAQGKSLEIIDSGHLEKLDPSVLAGLVDRTTIFSRVSPAHKLRIVEALQRSGKVVAMTGDGINDGPALKAANIGVTLGEKGTDVARSIADVILEDDDLKTMVTAIREGRAIYDNISKSLHFLLSTNLSEIEVMLVSAALGGVEILNPIQLLWINLVTDIFPALALALDPPEVDVLKRPPRDPNAAIVSRSDYFKLIRESGIITAGALGVYGYSRLRYGPGQKAGTHAFMSLTLAQLLHAYRCRSEHSSIFDSKNRPSNRYLDTAVGFSVLMQALAATLPPLRGLLRLSPIGVVDMIAILAGAGLPLLANEAVKGINLKRVVEPSKIPFAQSLSKGERDFG